MARSRNEVDRSRRSHSTRRAGCAKRARPAEISRWRSISGHRRPVGRKPRAVWAPRHDWLHGRPGNANNKAVEIECAAAREDQVVDGSIARVDDERRDATGVLPVGADNRPTNERSRRDHRDGGSLRAVLPLRDGLLLLCLMQLALIGRLPALCVTIGDTYERRCPKQCGSKKCSIMIVCPRLLWEKSDAVLPLDDPGLAPRPRRTARNSTRNAHFDWTLPVAAVCRSKDVRLRTLVEVRAEAAVGEVAHRDSRRASILRRTSARCPRAPRRQCSARSSNCRRIACGTRRSLVRASLAAVSNREPSPRGSTPGERRRGHRTPVFP